MRSITEIGILETVYAAEMRFGRRKLNKGNDLAISGIGALASERKNHARARAQCCAKDRNSRLFNANAIAVKSAETQKKSACREDYLLVKIIRVTLGSSSAASRVASPRDGNKSGR